MRRERQRNCTVLEVGRLAGGETRDDGGRAYLWWGRWAYIYPWSAGSRSMVAHFRTQVLPCVEAAVSGSREARERKTDAYPAKNELANTEDRSASYLMPLGSEAYTWGRL